jgi:flavin-dependent dehydrogenase
MDMRVLVVGAGPAGGAAAIALARGGATVRLVERSSWPRTKTCGDGISPDGVGIAAQLGIDLSDRLPLTAGTMSAPSRVSITSGWPATTPWGAIVERREFDDRLVQAAIAAGATFEPGTTVREIAPTGVGARVALRLPSGAPAQADVDAVLLAEGATGGLGATLGLGRHRSRLVALRGYVRSERDLDPAFGLHFDPAVVPGYAWIFPVTQRYANVGILVEPAICAPCSTGGCTAVRSRAISLGTGRSSSSGRAGSFRPAVRGAPRGRSSRSVMRPASRIRSPPKGSRRR